MFHTGSGRDPANWKIWTGRPAIASDALSFAIMAGRVNSVNHLVTTTSLLALTSDSVFHVDGDGSGGVLDATSPPATAAKSAADRRGCQPWSLTTWCSTSPA
jgi:hypothetical protein